MMNWNVFGFLKEYLPVITVVLSAFIAFISTVRHKDLERFYRNAESNLEKVIEPMYLKVKHIEAVNDRQHKIELIRDFFNTYDPKKMSISKLGNRQLINKFFAAEKAYNQFNHNFDEESLKSLFFKVRSLKYNIEKEYWRLFETIYKDYNWYKKTVDMNYVFRFFLRISLFIEQTFYAVTCIFFSFLFITVISQLISRGKFLESDDFWDKIYLISMGTVSSLFLLYFFIFVNHVFADDTKQKKRIRDYASLGFTIFLDKLIMKIKGGDGKRDH